MKFKEFKFKNTAAVEIENEYISIIVLPKIGSKIASIFSKKKEFEFLFQNKADKYQKAEFGADFAAYDCSGFDDCFPNIDQSKLLINSQAYLYPDHGEIWSAEFDYQIKEGKIILDYHSPYFKYDYHKTIELEKNRIRLNYRIKNNLKTAFPAIWTLHCLLNYEKNLKLNFPPDLKKVINVQQSDYLGDKGTEHSFPITKDKFGENYRLNRVNNRDGILTEKYYSSEEISNGKVSVYYPVQNTEFIIKYDPDKLPYLGFWLTEGGFKGDYNFAFEPTDGYYDSVNLALKNEKVNIIDPGAEYSFSIDLMIK
jgi:galactose mutarotase-like enzyme